MNLNEGRRAIHQAFAGPLADLGFEERKRLTFTRGEGNRIEIIAFSARGTREGQVCFSIGIGVRFEEVERSRAGSQQQELFYTIGQPLHLFRDDRRFTEWCIDVAVDPAIAMDVISQLKRYALPFFDKYRSANDVRIALESDRPSDWFTLSPRERQALLAAIRSLSAHR